MNIALNLGRGRVTLHLDRMPGGGGVTGGVLWRRLPLFLLSVDYTSSSGVKRLEPEDALRIGRAAATGAIENVKKERRK